MESFDNSIRFSKHHQKMLKINFESWYNYRLFSSKISRRAVAVIESSQKIKIQINNLHAISKVHLSLKNHIHNESMTMLLSWTALIKYRLFVHSKNCIFFNKFLRKYIQFFDVTKSLYILTTLSRIVPISTMVIDSLYEF